MITTVTPHEAQTLIDLVRAVADRRRALARIKQDLTDAQDQFKTANAWLFDRVQEEATRVGEAEDTLRAAALGVYADTGEKHPAPGVDIKVQVKSAWDDKKALDWATFNAPFAITRALNTKVFTEIAANLQPEDAAKLDYTETAVPQAQIGRDLDKVLV